MFNAKKDQLSPGGKNSHIYYYYLYHNQSIGVSQSS